MSETFPGRQAGHPDVHEDHAGYEPGDKDDAEEDSHPPVRVDQELAPIQEFSNVHCRILSIVMICRPAAPGMLAQDSTTEASVTKNSESLQLRKAAARLSRE